MEKEVKKIDVINAVLSYLMKKEYAAIAAQKANFREPSEIEDAKTGKKIKPDLSANLEGNTHLFEIEIKPEKFNSSDTISKWEKMANHAHSKGGSLYLIVLNDHRHLALNAIKENNIKANLLPVSFK